MSVSTMRTACDPKDMAELTWCKEAVKRGSRDLQSESTGDKFCGG